MEKWLHSDERRLLNQIPKNVVEWVWSDRMTDEEKEAHPEYKTTEGYLKVLDESDSAQIWWDGLRDEDRVKIKGLPNFNAEKFALCTGIAYETI